MKQEILDYIEAERPYGYDLLTRLAQIPAPSNHEEQRAKFVCDWFHQNGAPQAFIDQALNVVCPIGVTDSNPVTVFMAHMDVVFPDTTPLPLKVEDGRIFCPGIGDDTANLVALGEHLASQGITTICDMGNLDAGDNFPIYKAAEKRGFCQRVGIYYMWEFLAENKNFRIPEEHFDRSRRIFAAGLKQHLSY